MANMEKGKGMIELFAHNRTAYDSAVAMLSSKGKAAVIHPTGTGKSFIAFKLCEDNPDKRVCWLSPSEYIFKTQLENLDKSSGLIPGNIVFYTYARLMNLTEDEIRKIAPDYIILDEFHRCGAKEWGRGVNSLLGEYPSVPVLGMSATNIRYLDSRRDMADELFDGNVASEISLGEAIVRGILRAPKYVLSVFSYENELEKYRHRVRHLKNRAQRDEAEKYLNALCRALEKAEGLDTVFEKHMTDKHGKYIVFCADYEHMREMMTHLDWFKKVDDSPRTYYVYSNDQAASRSFQEFKDDNRNDRLRLLYCIDALNEGIHLDGISGVILLRPTVSPIIYKQQIGRALSAGNGNVPVIFDIVLNIESLSAIGAIEEEMEISAAYYRSLGESDEIVNEHFRITDELRDCRELFEKLGSVLSASWDVMYEHACEYYKTYGSLEVPARYMTEDGYSLGSWISNQRGIRNGTVEGKLSPERIEKLNSIGMVWDRITDLNWNRYFDAAEKYYREHGTLNVPARYATPEGLSLGGWITNLRSWEKSGAHSKYLTDERKKQLEGIGMVWDALDYMWEKNYSVAVDYYREHRNLSVPAAYVSPDGIRLGAWISRLRRLRAGKAQNGTVSESQIARLDAIGMEWSSGNDRKWEAGYSACLEYFRRFGNLNIPRNYRSSSDYPVGVWIKNQKKSFSDGKLSKERIQRLESIGMKFPQAENWNANFELLKEYLEENGSLSISQSYCKNGIWLGKWAAKQKKLLDEGKLPENRAKLLKELPLKTHDEDVLWFSVYEDAAEYARLHGELKAVPKSETGRSGVPLGAWLSRQRQKKKQGKLSEEKLRLLEKIGVQWKNDKWKIGYSHAKEYFESFGHLAVPRTYKCEDGFALGDWVFNYRKVGKDLSLEQAKALEQIGMKWKSKSSWDNRADELELFISDHGDLPRAGSDDVTEKKLAYWIVNQRRAYRAGELSQARFDRLITAGVQQEWLTPKNSSNRSQRDIDSEIRSRK